MYVLLLCLVHMKLMMLSAVDEKINQQNLMSLGDRFRPMLSVCCLSVLSVTLVYCGQTVRQIKMKLGMHVGSALATLC